MKKNIFFIFILSLIIITSGCTKKEQVNTNYNLNLNQNVSIEIRDMSQVPADYYSGNSRFSRGICTQDSECFNIGCSLEMCSNDKDMMTSCEIGGNFPDKNKYACGCIKDRCGWYKK